MDLTALQYTLLSVELLALAVGAVLLCRFLKIPGFKPVAPAPGRLAYWPVDGAEILLLIVLFLLLIFLSQSVFAYLFGHAIKASSDRQGMEVAVYGVAFHGGGLLAWPIFNSVRRRLFAAYGATPEPQPNQPPARVNWRETSKNAFITFLSALPLVALISVSWTSLLNQLGLPNEAQDMIAIFQNTRSHTVIAGMFFVACVLAPINEEMFFRRGLYHFLRQRFGRIIALGASAGLFGVMHWNLAGFLPLAVLGIMLALAYERTGDIRVSIIAHGLFNLNTIVVLLAGLSS